MNSSNELSLNAWSEEEDLELLEYFIALFEYPDNDPGFCLPNRRPDEILSRWEHLRLLDLEPEEWISWSYERKIKILDLLVYLRYDFKSMGEELMETAEKTEYLYEEMIFKSFEKLQEKAKCYCKNSDVNISNEEREFKIELYFNVNKYFENNVMSKLFK